MKHTKGNWYLQEYTDAYTNIVRCDDGVHNTLFIASTPQNNGEEARANAKLIAAAPDLLEACMNLENDDNSIPEHAWNLIQNAIKKATT